MLNFIISPLSTIPLVFGKQKPYLLIGVIASLLQIIGFVLIPWMLGNMNKNISFMFQCVTWAQVIMALITIYFLFNIVKKHDAAITEESKL